MEVEEGDTPEVLQRRVMEQAEWKILPKAIDLIANGKVKSRGWKNSYYIVRIRTVGKLAVRFDMKTYIIKAAGGNKMKVLIVVAAEEKACNCKSVAKSEKVDKIYCTPGNAGNCSTGRMCTYRSDGVR